MLSNLFGKPVPSINPQEAWKRVNNPDSNAVLIDVRETWEFKGGHAKRARNIPLSTLQQRWNEIPPDKEVLIICQSGNRSVQAVRFLQKQGIEQAINVSGGTSIWQMHGLPMEGGRR